MRNFCLLAGLTILSPALLGAAPPGNDNFSNAQQLTSSLPVTQQGSTSAATLETGEWNPAGRGGNSVWYSWTAPYSGWVAIDTISADPSGQLDTVIAVFTGTSITNLVAIGYNDEAWFSPSASQLVFYADGGVTYRIAVHGYLGAQGLFDLNISTVSPTAKVSDISVSPASVDVSGSPQSATVTVTVESDADLFAGGGVNLKLNRPDGNGSLTVSLGAAYRTTGDSFLGTYVKQITIPRLVPAGNWVPSVEINGTYAWSPQGGDAAEDYWVIRGNSAPVLVVQNTAAVDSQAPALDRFSVTPQTAARYGIVTLHLGISDTGGSGFQRADIWLIEDGIWLGEVTAADRVSGDESNGEYEISFPVPYFIEPGTHHFSVYIEDAATNWSYENGAISGSSLESHPLGVLNFSSLESWRIHWFGLAVNGGNAANTADPDKDGIVNLLEFATNSDPTATNSGASSVAVEGGLLTLSYARAYAAVADGVQFFAEWSDSPGGPWATSDVQETVVGSDASVQNIRASVSLGSANRRFMRLRVLLPTP